MRLLLKGITLSILISFLVESQWTIAATPTLSRAELEKNFADPSCTPIAAYWYWISGNVTPKGIEEDVYAMKRAGINRAFIGFQGLPENEAPRGPVYLQTQEWYECLRSAMRTAAKEGVEIGVFNAPGWSQSGGPWVTPEKSQRYLSISELNVKGGQSTEVILPKPSNWLSDVKVVARRKQEFTEIHVTPKLSIEGKDSLIIEPDTEDFTLRSIVVKTKNSIKGRIYVSAQIGGKWSEIHNFEADRTVMLIEMGYDLLAPTVAAVPETKAERFKIQLALNPDCQVSDVVLSEEPLVDAYTDQNFSRLYQGIVPPWEAYKWKNVPVCSSDAVVSINDIIDITEKISGDTLRWNIPEGNWIISRISMSPTNVHNWPTQWGDGRGLEIDRWDYETLELHYNSFIGDIIQHIPTEERTTWKYIVADSYERASQNFGDDFIEKFKERYNYDPVPFLLTYNGTVVGSQELSQRFLWDMHRFVADRLAYDYVGGLRKMANNDGFKLWLEPYGHGGFPGESLMYGGQSDEVAGEFWSEGTTGDEENRIASSVAHTYGKGVCWSESFTCSGNEFSRSPRTMKQRADKFFTEGVNATLLHLIVSQPDDSIFPGLNCPYGNEFNRKNTWFPQVDLFTDYLKRTNFMLQQGTFVADIAYFIGEDCPVMCGPIDSTLPSGYQFDYINAEVIMTSLSADENHILSLPHGTKYRLLVLPDLETMRPELLRRIKDLIIDGAIVLGIKPHRSPSLQNYPECDDEVKALAEEIWGSGNFMDNEIRKIGNGFIINGHDIGKALELIGVIPDFTYLGTADVKYAHVSDENREIYFIANQKNELCEITAMFRSGCGFQPELWNATNGTRRQLATCDNVDGYTSIPLQLAPMESAFIVFEYPITTSDVKIDLPSTNRSYDIKSSWDVTLTSMLGELHNIRLDSIIDLSKHPDDEVKYFSGTANYVTYVELPHKKSDHRYILDIGDVREMARIKINNQYIGGIWTAPYTIDITDSIKKGKNKIEIDVVNTWVNRLIGDSRLAKDIRKTSLFYRTLTPESQLQPSGLLNNVRILEQ